jgi:hypothetical protein
MKLNTFVLPIAFLGSLAVSSVTLAQAPAGSTGQCKDGTYTSVEKKRGACAGHKGVKEWFGAEAKSEAKSAKSAKSESKATGAKSEAKATGAKSEAKATGAKSESKATGAKTEAKDSGAMTPPATTGAIAPAAPAAAARPSGSMSAASSGKAAQGMRAEAAPGGGAGKVWVNTSTHVYHCTGDEWYGKTKSGEYMSEAAAKAAGAHAARGKACA